MSSNSNTEKQRLGTARRQRDYAKRQSEKGLRRVGFWVSEDEAEKLRAYLKLIREP